MWDDYTGKGVYKIDGPSNAVDQYPQKVTTPNKTNSYLLPAFSSLLALMLIILKRRK